MTAYNYTHLIFSISLIQRLDSLSVIMSTSILPMMGSQSACPHASLEHI